MSSLSPCSRSSGSPRPERSDAARNRKALLDVGLPTDRALRHRRGDHGGGRRRSGGREGHGVPPLPQPGRADGRASRPLRGRLAGPGDGRSPTPGPRRAADGATAGLRELPDRGQPPARGADPRRRTGRRPLVCGVLVRGHPHPLPARGAGRPRRRRVAGRRPDGAHRVHDPRAAGEDRPDRPRPDPVWVGRPGPPDRREPRDTKERDDHPDVHPQRRHHPPRDRLRNGGPARRGRPSTATTSALEAGYRLVDTGRELRERARDRRGAPTRPESRATSCM